MTEFEDAKNPKQPQPELLDRIKLLRALANFYVENPASEESRVLANQRQQLLKIIDQLEADCRKFSGVRQPEEALAEKPSAEPDETEKEIISKFIRLVVPKEARTVWDADKFTGSLLVFFVDGQVDSSSLIEKKSEPFNEDDFGTIDDANFSESRLNHVKVVNEPGEMFTILKSPTTANYVIHFKVAEPSLVRIRIHNDMEQLIQQFERRYDRPGEYSVEWDGRNEHGNPLPNGTYFCQVQIGDTVSERKAVELK